MIVRTLAALVAVAAAVACGPRATGRGLLPASTRAASTPSPYQPERGYAGTTDDGVLTRQVYRTDATSTYAADIRDLIVPPGKATSLAHPGLVVVDTREGTGTATLGDHFRNR